MVPLHKCTFKEYKHTYTHTKCWYRNSECRGKSCSLCPP